MKILALVICAAALFSSYVFAADRQFKNGEAVTIRQDEAYVLVRSFRPPALLGRGEQVTPILIRALSDEEMQQGTALSAQDPNKWKDKIEANVFEPLGDQPHT